MKEDCTEKPYVPYSAGDCTVLIGVWPGEAPLL